MSNRCVLISLRGRGRGRGRGTWAGQAEQGLGARARSAADAPELDGGFVGLFVGGGASGHDRTVRADAERQDLVARPLAVCRDNDDAANW